jgi:DNA-binding transcriptional LysR family regulator
MTDPDFNLLIALDALLTEASVAGAARRLNLSTSAMSRTLSRLRDVTGDPLLVRAGRTMVLTPYAQASRDRARNAVLEVRAVLQPSTTELNLAELERVFTLRANDGFIEAFGPVLIAAVAAVAPRVCLRFAPKPEKSARYLREGLVDLEIGVLSNMGPEIRLQTLFRDRFVGVVRKGHPLEALASVSVSDYIAWGHVIASRRGQPHGPVDEALAERGLTRKIVSVVPGFPSALAVAQASDLIALVPASFLNPPDTHTRLHMFELPFKTRAITVSQMWHPRMEVDPAHRWLRQTVLAVCQRHYPQNVS